MHFGVIQNAYLAKFMGAGAEIGSSGGSRQIIEAIKVSKIKGGAMEQVCCFKVGATYRSASNDEARAEQKWKQYLKQRGSRIGRNLNKLSYAWKEQKMEVNNIRIYRDAYEELVKLKEERYPDMGAMGFYTEIIKKGIAAERNGNDHVIAADKDPAKEPTVEKSTEAKDNLKPDWVKGLSVEEIQRYCYEHPGAKKEYLNWWAQSHTPKQVESMKLTLSTKWW